MRCVCSFATTLATSASVRRYFWIFAVVASFVGLRVEAFTPGPTVFLECPGCRQLLKLFTTNSGNTRGAKFWTDGKMDAPMLPDIPPIAKCPKCDHVFWWRTANQLGSIPDAKLLEQTPQPAKASENDLLKFSSAQKWTRDELMMICRRAWWLANDGVRYHPQAAENAFSEAQLQNLKRFFETLDPTKPEERITKAEIARELGLFDDCVQLLTEKFEKPQQIRNAEFILALAKKKDSVVRQFR